MFRAGRCVSPVQVWRRAPLWSPQCFFFRLGYGTYRTMSRCGRFYASCGQKSRKWCQRLLILSVRLSLPGAPNSWSMARCLSPHPLSLSARAARPPVLICAPRRIRSFRLTNTGLRSCEALNTSIACDSVSASIVPFAVWLGCDVGTVQREK